MPMNTANDSIVSYSKDKGLIAKLDPETDTLMVLSDLVRGHVERAIDISLQSIPQTLNIGMMKEELHLKEEEDYVFGLIISSYCYVESSSL